MTNSYQDILKRGMDEVPDLKPLPTGTWLLKVLGAPKFQPPKEEGRSGQVMFVFQPVEPGDDVDADEIEALGANYDTAGNRIFHKPWVETSADWAAIRRLLVKLGADASDNFEDAFKAVKGATVYADVGYRTYTNNAGEVVEENTASNFQAVE